MPNNFSDIILTAGSADDDPELRRILRENPLPGEIRVAFTREPDYFAACEVEGDTVDIATARDRRSGKIVGFGTRAEKPAYINGRQSRIGYLSALRILPEFRNGLLLARGYKLIRQFHQAGKTQLYLSTIIEDNVLARKILTAGRGGLPTYQDAGRYHTFAIRPGRKKRLKIPSGLSIRPAENSDCRTIIDFLNENGRQRQFYPCYSIGDLQNGDGLLRNLFPGDIYLLENKDGILACAAAWNQKPFKQSIIDGYHRSLAILRPIYNIYASVFNRPGLPGRGKQIHYKTLALVAVKNDHRANFELLLNFILDDQAGDAELHSIMMGFHEDDPLLSVAQRLPHIEYRSRLYIVYWPDGQEAFQKLNDNIPYLELGAL